MNKYSLIRVVSKRDTILSVKKDRILSMDITESLFQALTLFGLGMTFVFSFLGLLMIAVKLMAKYIPADKPVVNNRASNKKAAAATATTSTSEINPQLIAAITTAVQQYRKIEAA